MLILSINIYYIYMMSSISTEFQKITKDMIMPIHADQILSLVTPFKMDGKLIIRLTPPYRDPMESCERLYLKSDNHEKRIKDLNDLQGHVKSTTVEMALSYVRILTSPRTFHLFVDRGTLEVEIISREAINKNITYGDAEYAARLQTVNEGKWGIANSTFFKKHRIVPATCRLLPNGFEITRTLLSEKKPYFPERYFITQVTEWVGKDGTYKVIKKIQHPSNIDNLRIPKLD